jgi:hypothetical protein
VGHEVIVHAKCGDDTLVAKLGAHRIPRFGEVDRARDGRREHSPVRSGQRIKSFEETGGKP